MDYNPDDQQDDNNGFQRNTPILAFQFFDLRQKGLKWRALLHVAEPFHRLLGESLLAFNATDFYPEMVRALENAGYFPEINSCDLMKKSNTFIVRFNLSYAYDFDSAFETMQAVGYKLMGLIQDGSIPNPYANLMNYDATRIGETFTMTRTPPMLDDDDDDPDMDDDAYTDDDADDVALPDIWSNVINKILDKPAKRGKRDDDDDTNYGGGNVPVPMQ